MKSTILLIAIVSVVFGAVSLAVPVENVSKDASKSLTGNVNDPVMLDHVLMENFRLGISNGRPQIRQLRAMHLPASLDKTRNFKAAYKRTGGAKLAEFSAYAQAPNRNVSWLLGNFRRTDESGGDLLLSDVGDYVLEFSVNGQAFDKFSFSVAKHKHVDGSVKYIRNGPWNDLGYIYYDKNARRPELSFVFWLRDLLEGTGVRPDNTGKYLAKLVRNGDGKTIGISNKEGRSSFYPTRQWKKQSISFMDAEKPERLTAETVLAKDGDYHIEFNFEGKLYGKYPFSVKGGSFHGLTAYKGEKIGSDGTVFWTSRK